MKLRSQFLRLCLLLASCFAILLSVMFFWRIPVHAIPAGMPAIPAYALTIGLYICAVAFITAAIFAWQLLGRVIHQNAFTVGFVQLLNQLKWACVGIQVGAVLMLPGVYTVADRTDAPGVMAIGLTFFAVWLFITVFIAILQRLWQLSIEHQTTHEAQ